ncbi:hypothetical protein EKPJFOCH_2984 [Methylobacterium thuringiense]|uniref:Uncharacterized protein n=1 Tax=Methylobacterium thuringiense TaxID=1003091 RepID=A0ABQ4TPD4_9HYPH|nr:hypothetical protein EKPJFOCH_2984 [Methylobacterium thuringiense]
MATLSKVPAWVQRRISDRPVARWITWNAGRPSEPETREPASQPMMQPDYSGNVVSLFKRSA